MKEQEKLSPIAIFGVIVHTILLIIWVIIMFTIVMLMDLWYKFVDLLLLK